MTTPTNDRVVLYAMDPRRTPSDPFETPITDADGNVLPEAKQYKVSTGSFLIDQDQVFWGDIQISAMAANGDRGIVKSTHDLLGVKSYTYAPGNFNQAKLDNALNYMPDEGGTEIISLDFPGTVNEVTLILALLDNAQEQVQWQAFDEAGNSIDGGVLTTLDGTQIDALDSEELNFGEDTTYEFNLPTTGVARLELSALPETGYSLAGIAYTPDDGTVNAAPVITSPPTASVFENQTFAIDIEASDDVDAEGAGLTYALTGGDDAGLFDVDADTGVVTFSEAPDFENPADADADNTYDVQVTVTDSEGGTDVQSVAIAVTNEPEGSATPQAFLSIHSGKNAIRISTFAADSFLITNQSTDGLQIEQVIFDIGSSILPNLVFDPAGTAGDVVAGGLEIDSGAVDTGYVVPADNTVDPFSETFGDGGFTTMTLNFTDFDPGETMTFNVDVDPTNIEGDTGSGDAGSISGSELIGSTATLVFSDGSTLAGEFFTDGSTSGSQTLVTPTSVAGLTVEVVNVDLAPDANGFYTGTATVGNATQTVKVMGQPGQTVTLLQIESSGEPGEIGGVPVTTLAPFETNAVVRTDDQTTVLDANGEAFFQVTLTDTADPDEDVSGVNLFAVAPVDSSGVVAGAVTEPIALRLQSVPVLPEVNLSVTSNTGSEADTTAITVTATASSPVSGEQSVAVAVTGSGITASDFGGTIPASLTIPDGATAASFTVNISDDVIAEGEETATFSLSDPSTGLVLGSMVSSDVAIADNETPALTLAFDTTSIAENGGTATATVTRNTSTGEALTVTLSSSDASEATVPATVVIPAGQTSATFTVLGIDDAIADGTQTPTVTASAPNFATGSVDLAVTDDESAALTLDIDAASIAENGGTATATVTRNTDTSTDLTVILGSSDTSEATVPATVVIPAGQQAASFTVMGVDDAEVDGTQTAVITASASGLTNSAATLDVADDDEVDAPTTLRVEAEDIAVTTAYRTENNVVASGNQVLSLRGVTDSVGSVTFDFAGVTGTYTLVLGTFDETDGESSFTVTQDGNPVGNPILLDQDLGSAAPDATTQVMPVVASGVSITSGDSFTITGSKSQGEFARLDFIEFQFEDEITNTLPIALDDAVATDEDTPLNGNVLTNDNDADGDALTVTAVNGMAISVGMEVELASGALLTLNADGSFNYAPNGQFEFLGVGETAIDSFDYTISDGQGSSTATATVTVEGAEEPALELTITVDSLAENGGTTMATVTRTGSTHADVTVNLSSSDISEVAVPDTVVIAAGQTAATFPVTAVDDAVVDGPQSATITASATGLTDSAVDLTITDDDPVVSEPGGILLALNEDTMLQEVEATVQDIVQFDGDSYSLFFDGSDVGVVDTEINAFDAISDTEILMSFDNPVAIAGLGMVDDSDIVKFTASSLGENTAGSFSLVFDGSDVGLSNGAEDIDGLVGLSDGNLLISVNGNLNPGNGSIASSEDVVLFAPTSTGAETAGSFSLFADGSDVGLADENIDAFGTDTGGNLYVSFTNSFAVGSAAGQDEDVAILAPASTGENTSGSFDSELFLDGSENQLKFRDVQGVDLTFTAV
ncbi:MAG: beta strand repeat-containing protein [Leptolyngbyaceae cyanobacterium]